MAVAAEDAEPWTTWLNNFGHDSFAYTAWIGDGEVAADSSTAVAQGMVIYGEGGILPRCHGIRGIAAPHRGKTVTASQRHLVTASQRHNASQRHLSIAPKRHTSKLNNLFYNDAETSSNTLW